MARIPSEGHRQPVKNSLGLVHRPIKGGVMTDWFGAKPILDRSHGRRGAWNTHPQPCPEQRGHLAHHDTLHSSKHQLHKGPDTLVRPVENTVIP
jgi:hypothetical protein